MDIKLKEIVGKPAGTYFIVTDKSTITDIEQTSNLRLIFISSPKGAVNTVFIFQKGDVSGFNTIFGKSSRKQEKRGNFSLKTAEQMIQGGPIAVMNLRKFEDIDMVGICGLDSNHAIDNEINVEVPYTKCFNTNSLWTIKPKQILGELTQEHLLNLANVGDNDSSVFVIKSKANIETLTADANLSLRNSSLEIDDYPGLDFDMLVSDTFVDIYVFDTMFDPKTVGTNKYYGHLFDSEGCIENTSLDELTKIPEAGFNRFITGSLIPDLKNELSEEISIDTLTNSLFAETGIICYINDNVLETENPDTIDLHGYSFSNDIATGVLTPTNDETILSHKIVSSSKVLCDAIPSEAQLLDYVSNKESYKKHNLLSQGVVEIATDLKSITICKDFGIMVGDKLVGKDDNIVTVTKIELVSSDNPVAEPIQAKIKKVTNSEIK